MTFPYSRVKFAALVFLRQIKNPRLSAGAFPLVVISECSDYLVQPEGDPSATLGVADGLGSDCLNLLAIEKNLDDSTHPGDVLASLGIGINEAYHSSGHLRMIFFSKSHFLSFQKSVFPSDAFIILLLSSLSIQFLKEFQKNFFSIFSKKGLTNL